MAFKKIFTKRNIIIVLVAAAAVCLIVFFAVKYFNNQSNSPGNSIAYQELDPPDVTSHIAPSSSILGKFTKAVVVSNGELCATIGREILDKNGSAVDALIATMLCDGVMCLQNMGIGGGFFMTLYTKANNSVVTLNARETAPAAAKEDMYKDNATASQDGALAIAVPGELKGYYAAWSMYGKLNWSELFEPTIKLCKEGVPVNQHLAENIASMEEEIRANKLLSEILVINGTLVKKGDNITLPKLAETLNTIATSPSKIDELYNGSLTDGIVKEIQSSGGIITKEDLNSYTVEWGNPIVAKLSGGLTMYSMPPPGSGVLVGFILRILDNYIQNATTDIQIAQRITEAFKHAYGRRSDLGDKNFYKIDEVMQDLTSEVYITQTRNKISDSTTSQNTSYYGAHYAQLSDHGTANIVVLAPNGDAAVATSTVNLLFGSKFVSESTGIIFNDQMDDFSSSYSNYFGVPPSPANYIKPGKRPLSSMCPTIFVDANGDVRLALGAAGGTKITTSVALVSIQNLWYNKNIKEAVDEPRIHHQLQPMNFYYEYGTLRSIAKGMADIGHKIIRRGVDDTWGSCVTAVARSGANAVQGNSDFRRPGGVDGL